jgi:succinate dehydrogenase / fumarate reductase flavoprotein subunit
VRVSPGVRCSLGGLWSDYETGADGLVVGSTRNHHSDIPGVFVIGEADYHYHGAGYLSGNGLLSSVFGGLVTAPGVAAWAKATPFGRAENQPVSLFDSAVEPHARRMRALVESDGAENPHELHAELAATMTKALGPIRADAEIRQALEKIHELKNRYRGVALPDRSNWLNHSLSFARAVGDMITLAEVVAMSALLRSECRGAHFKPDHELVLPREGEPGMTSEEAEAWCRSYRVNNEKWLKTTLARHTSDGPVIEYGKVDTSLLRPRPRVLRPAAAEVIARVWNEVDENGPGSETPAVGP